MKTSKTWALVVVAALGALLGSACGKITTSPPDGGDGGGGLTAAQACANLAQAECDERDRCSNGTSITRVYGEKSVCLARGAALCMNALAAPDTGATPATVSRCTAAYASLSCNDFFDAKLPADCSPAGPRANGQPCVFPGQCASAYCGGTRNALCGTCATAPAAGDSCADSLCGHGQTCLDAGSLCAALGTLNTPCDAADPCGNGLSCVGSNAASGTQGTCQVALAQVDAACGGTKPGCNGSTGLSCAGPVGSKTCTAISYLGDGASCGVLATGAFALCKAGTCYTATGVAGGSDVGTCKLDAIEGGACDTAVGPSCMAPARCVVSGSGTAGICAMATGTGCGA